MRIAVTLMVLAVLVVGLAVADEMCDPDGTQFQPAVRLKTWGGSWADAPVEPVEARYVRLNVVQGGADGLIHVAQFDVFGHPSDLAQP